MNKFISLFATLNNYYCTDFLAKHRVPTLAGGLFQDISKLQDFSRTFQNYRTFPGHFKIRGHFQDVLEFQDSVGTLQA